MKKVYIETNGCAVLRHDTYKIAKYVELNNYEEVTNPIEADYIIVTGCAVINENENYAIELIKKLYNENKEHATIIVAGCISTIASERITSIANDIIQINNNNMDMFDEYFYSKVKIKNVDFNIEPKRHHSSGDPFIVIDNEEKQDKKFVERIDELTGLKNGITQFDYSTRGRHLWRESDLFEIKVASGCTGKCSYCATKLAIGDFKSICEDRIIMQAIDAKKNGYKRIMLMGDEIGAWNDNGKNIIDLINDILNIDSEFKIGIRYIQPDIIVKYYYKFKELFASGNIYYFCAAFQSGSERILKLMNRNPNIEPFIKCMEDIEKNNYPVLRHTQIIIGFPGETELDVLKTLNTLQRASFDHVTISAYSRREGTNAYRLEPLPADIVNYRMKLFEEWLKLNRNNKIYKTVRNELNNNINNNKLMRVKKRRFLDEKI